MMKKFKQYIENVVDPEKQYWINEAQYFITYVLEDAMIDSSCAAYGNPKIISELAKGAKDIFTSCLKECEMKALLHVFKSGEYDKVYIAARKNDQFDSMYMSEIEKYFKKVLFNPDVELLELLLNLEPHRFVEYFIDVMKQSKKSKMHFKRIENNIPIQERMIKINPECYQYMNGIHPEIVNRYSNIDLGNKFGMLGNDDEEV